MRTYRCGVGWGERLAREVKDCEQRHANARSFHVLRCKSRAKFRVSLHFKKSHLAPVVGLPPAIRNVLQLQERSIPGVEHKAGLSDSWYPSIVTSKEVD